MRINWVFAASCEIDPTVDINLVKNIGATWGSWKSWRSCETDNVVCNDLAKAKELLKRAFQAVCNFYVPRGYYEDLGRPVGLKLYDGQFAEQVNDIEDIISLHLVAGISDIVLLKGFDLRKPVPTNDRFEQHKIQNRLGMIRSVTQKYPEVQWVLVDHPGELDKGFQNLPNLTCDKLENVIQLLV